MASKTKTHCPITRDQFEAHAPETLPVVIAGTEAPEAGKRTFSSDSLGWYANGKMDVVVGGVKCPCQVSTQVTLIGSKELPLRAVQMVPQAPSMPTAPVVRPPVTPIPNGAPGASAAAAPAAMPSMEDLVRMMAMLQQQQAASAAAQVVVPTALRGKK